MSVFVLVWLKSELSSWCSCRSIVTMLRRCIVDPQHCGDLGVIIPHSVLLIHPYSLTVSRQTKIIKAAATNSLTHSLSYFLSRSSTYCTRNNSASLQVALLTSTLTEDDISLCHFEQITHSFCRFVVLSFCRFVVLSLRRSFGAFRFCRSIVRSFDHSFVRSLRTIVELKFRLLSQPRINTTKSLPTNAKSSTQSTKRKQTNERTNERTEHKRTALRCIVAVVGSSRRPPTRGHTAVVGWLVGRSAVWLFGGGIFGSAVK